MPFSEIVIAAGSKALVACLSQYIKYKLKNDCIEKKIEADPDSYYYTYQLRGVEGNAANYIDKLSLFSITILMIYLLL